MPKKAAATAEFHPHPGIVMVQKWIAELPAKTGRSLDEWVAFTKKAGPATEEGRRDWLKKEHGFGTNAAWWIAERTFSKGTEDSDPDLYLMQAAEYVETMYAGKKAALKPIHDALLKLARKMFKDLKVCPCQTIVPLYRNHVFAQIKPTTNTRLDFGYALAKYAGKIPARLIDTGGKAKGDRITHRIPLTSLDEIDDDVKRWLQVAYDLDVK